jgi:hypothetical protein
MQNLAKLIRIEPAFDDPDMIRSLFERHAPYRTIAEYIPRRPEQPAFPYFRGNWAVGGEPLVDGVETILHNHRFIEAAGAVWEFNDPSHVHRSESKRANARRSDSC